MFEIFDSLIQPERAIMMLIALSVFATILTVAAPMLEGDKLRGRMKQVSSERDRLRAAHKANLSGDGSRLRERTPRQPEPDRRGPEPPQGLRGRGLA